MTTTLHYAREEINNSAHCVFVVVVKLDAAELTASVVINLDKNVMKKEH